MKNNINTNLNSVCTPYIYKLSQWETVTDAVVVLHTPARQLFRAVIIFCGSLNAVQKKNTFRSRSNKFTSVVRGHYIDFRTVTNRTQLK